MDKWIPGTITTRLGDLHYEIDFQGKMFKRHIDQIRARKSNGSASDVRAPNMGSQRRIYFYEPATPNYSAGPVRAGPSTHRSTIPSSASTSPEKHTATTQRNTQVSAAAPVLRRSSRPRQAPQRYQ